MSAPRRARPPPRSSLVTLQTTFSRRLGDFTLHLIDTPSLLEQDNVAEKVRP